MLLMRLCVVVPEVSADSETLRPAAVWSIPEKRISVRTRTKKSVKTLKKKAEKTCTKKKETKSKDTNIETEEETKTKTVIDTTVTTISKYKKGSRKVSVSTVTRTVTTTYKYMTVNALKELSADRTALTLLPAAPPVAYNITDLAGRADANLLRAFDEFGMTLIIDGSADALGTFRMEERQIILKRQDSCIYHELGHFLFFVAGRTDRLPAANAVYLAEKDLVTSVNSGYSNASVGEYFAEAYRCYVLDRDALLNERPQTCAVVQDALSKVTDAQVLRIKNTYSAVWK